MDKSFPLCPRNVFNVDGANNSLPRLRSQRRNRGMQQHRFKVVLGNLRQRVVKDGNARAGLRNDGEAHGGGNGALSEIRLLDFSFSLCCHSCRRLQTWRISGREE